MIKMPSLHTHTEYTFLGSTIKIDSLISFALEKGLNALAITDRNNMFGVSEFIHKCKANNIKPIIGIDIDIEMYRLVLLAKNYDGYKELLKLASMKAKNKDVNFSDINDRDIFIIDHPTQGFYAKKNKQLEFRNYFIATNENISNAIFFNETIMLNEREKESIAVLRALKFNQSIEPSQVRSVPYIYEGDENLSSVKQVQYIVSSCNVVFPKNEAPMPRYVNPEGMTSISYLKKIIQENAAIVLKDVKNQTDYIQRIKYEISVIEKLGFADYFLIIWDLIKWAKDNSILIGPGRGSSSGSLIAFVLKITEIDPLKNELLFERFLNPERVTMPDVDIDIQHDRRDDVVKYLFDKYSSSHVALISTVSRLAAKSALRDIARLLGISNGEVSEITKLIKDNQTLTDAYNNAPRFRAAISRTELAQKLYRYATMIEGLARQHGTHAAGIVITNRPVEEIAPTINSANDLNQIQYSMDYLEEHNLLKIDLLALSNLTTLVDIKKEVFKTHKKNLDLSRIPLDDKLTNQLLTSGDTNGIFQLESYGMKDALKLIKVSSLDDVVAIISLYRPGPMDTIKDYAAYKSGEKTYQSIAKSYDEVVSKTFGSMIYQEQIMHVAQRFASMSFGQADILRRAISKKNHDEIEKLKTIFFDGARKNNHPEEVINKVYEMIEKFADYGFNKCHAVAYATLSYRMAFLKAHFPFEFYTAILATSVGSTDKIKTYVTEAKNRNINIVSPNINTSEVMVENKNKSIILPLSIIKGFGDESSKKVIAERSNSPFVDFFDVVFRLKNIGIGDQHILSLINANALRDFGNMQTLTDAMPQALRYADMKKTINGNVSFELPKPKLIQSQRDADAEVRNEFNAFGFNIMIFETSDFEKSEKLKDVVQGKDLTLAVKVISKKESIDKNNNRFAKYELSDSSTTIEAYAFWDVYKFIELTKMGKIVEVTISKRNDRFNITKPWKELK